MQQYRSDKQGEEKSTIDLELAMIPQVSFMKCPIKTSLEGITPRVLSMRLKELEKSFIERAGENRSPMIVQWRLTEKGKDTLPI